MRDVSINIEDIKHFFVKKKKEKNKIITKRLFGISLRYVRSRQYRDLTYLLNIIYPCLENDISDIIEDFKKKQKFKYISAQLYEKDLKTVNEILDKTDISNIPQADGSLRKYQLNLLQFAKEITDDIKNNTDIPVWLDGGTLLGAVRHKGFIPWDDDMDFAALRPDYNRLIKYLQERYTCIDTQDWLLGKYAENISVCVKKFPNQIFVFRNSDAFKCVKTTPDFYYIIDFFAWDYYNKIHNVVTLQKYADILNQKAKGLTTYRQLFEMFGEEFKKEKDIVKESNVLNMGIDNHGFQKYTIKENVRKQDIFPLIKLKFEDWEFEAPNNCNVYLKSIYNYYNKLPEFGIAVTPHVNTKNMEI